jgi:tryptophan synthase alpha chain
MAEGVIETALRAVRAGGGKALVPYVTGGLDAEWPDAVRAVAAAGADAVEIGIPFSDPVMDGPVIQRASERALAAGATPGSVLAAVAHIDVDVPLVVMTYYNIVFHAGHHRFARSLADAGIAGAIVPDLPLDEAGDWLAEAEAAGVETILLAAPTTPDDRLARICAASRGWVYAVGMMGVTGERAALASSAAVMGTRVKAVTDKPVLIGIGVSTPEQAVEAAITADGVIVGSALVRRLLDGEGPDGARDFVASLRAVLPRART